jgi:NTP pyrophosphatase (non-canonical NTP hydrolase)
MQTFEQIDQRRIAICKSWGLFDQSNPMAQMTKLAEEFVELKHALLEDDTGEIIDAIGDMTVVLGNIASMLNLSLPDCYASAVHEISKRRGHIDPDSGLFIKAEG